MEFKIEVIVLSSETKDNCPIYKFDEWKIANSFIQFQIEHGFSVEVNGFIEKD